MGEMRVLDMTGDTKIEWNIRNRKQVADAREEFNKFIARGFAAFLVGEDGKKHTRVFDFDPAAGQLIIVPVVQGG